MTFITMPPGSEWGRSWAQKRQGDRGEGTKDPSYAKPALLYHVLLKWLKEGWEERVGRRRWGHSVSMPERYYKTTEGVKNKQLGWHRCLRSEQPPQA